MTSVHDHLSAVVRAADRDRYLSVLYAPVEKRDGLLALYAFNAEIAAIRDRISEPLPGEIRLQWWRDTLDAGNADVGNPTASALIETIRRYDLPLSAFHNYLDARIFDLYDDPMPSRTDLEGYCGDTASAIIQLAAMILDRDKAAAYSGVAGHAGCAQAITGLLRLMPIHRARGQIYIPRDIFVATGASTDEFLSVVPGEGAARAVTAMISLARDHLSSFEKGAAEISMSLRPAFLPMAPVDAYLGALQKLGHKALLTSAGISAFRLHFLLLLRATRGW